MKTKGTVLIIDDELDSCILWKSFLSHLKFEVYTALTLQEGLKIMESIKPAIIFLDNNLPDGLGWEQLDTIQEKLPSAIINLVSAHHFDPGQWVRKNVNVLAKPVTLSHIRSLLAA